MRRFFCSLAFALSLLAAACGPTPHPASSGKLKVVATFSILGDLVKNVAGDKIDLFILVGPDGDTHTYEPTPADDKTLAAADLIFENGLGFESWLDKLYTASAAKAKRIVVTQGVQPGKIAIGQEAGATDPHAWQDVTYAMRMVTLIRDGLVQADPANAKVYQDNAQAYLDQLKVLDQYILSQAGWLPAARRKLVTNHDALGYFAQRYGFQVIGTALSSVSTEAGDPSAADLAKLVNEIKHAGVPAIFTENVENSAVIDQVAQEAGVKVGPLLYTDALGQPGTAGETYLKMMRYNIDAIVPALRP
jgi:ABC-type Zn uptake system ZnuABC Zn-binding protein ZnuA